MSEMKNTLDWINKRFDNTKERISKFEDIAIESFPKKFLIYKEKKISGQIIVEMWHKFKRPSVCVIGLPSPWKRRAEKYLEK